MSDEPGSRIGSRRAFLAGGVRSGVGALILASPLAPAWSYAAAPRPNTWAQRVELAGVPNLHRVTARFYRSAQPSADGFANLSRQLAVRSIVSLRAFHADDVLSGGSHLRLTRIPIHTWHIEDKDVVAALRALRQGQRYGAVLLHCQHGADRTGLISALYRVIYQGWSKADALAEMRGGAFGYHAVWGNIPRYLKSANIATLRAAIG
ncbi:protein-tyrosine-phosphatase [Labrys sp. KNU-23]|nr:protein-tyrosine-phosphatase [Labrys sp. KNU-23]